MSIYDFEHFKPSINLTSHEQIEPSINLSTPPKKVRGRNKATIKLIEAMKKIAEETHPITGRGVGYKLFTLGLINGMHEMTKVYPALKHAREDGIIPWAHSVRQVLTAYSDETQIVKALSAMETMGLNLQTGINGVYNLFDKDGYHYCVSGGTKVLKSFDDNEPGANLRIIASKNLIDDLPPDVGKSVSRIIGLAMTYDGYLAAVAPGAAFIVDRNLNVKSYVSFGDEAVDNSVCIDDKGGVYVVTSKRMLRLAWTGKKLSTDEADGAWESPYESMDPQKAMALGAISRGSGTTPSLMGFGDEPDKLVVIADAAEGGTNLVAFWREAIPEGFKQKRGTLSRRIADQIKIDISTLTIEPSPNVLAYGVAVINGSYPQPFPQPGPPNQFTAGVTRKAPLGVQKFNWNPNAKKFEKAWTNMTVDNTDIMVPVVSAATNMIYCATKVDSNYAYVGLDWTTGETKQTWLFPDDSRKWNALGGITTILEDGDLLIGGAFTIKRLIDAS
jgi:hypothetical protein